MQKKIVKEKNKLINYLEFNNISLKNLLEEIINKKIYDIEYIGLEELNQIPEYKFELLKLNIFAQNDKKYNVFLKLINKYKINETIFCYWYFCEKKYCIDNSNLNRYCNKKANIIKYKNVLYKKKFNIQLLNKNNKIWRNTDIHLIELEKYIQNKCRQKQVNSRTISNLDEILFVGII